MMFGSMVFCKVVCLVLRTWFPKNLELALIDAVSNPIESHVDGFRSLLFYIVICDSTCCGVVNLDRGGWLWESHCLEAVPRGCGLFGIHEELVDEDDHGIDEFLQVLLTLIHQLC